MALFDRISRFFGLRRVSPERQPEIRHVPMGNVTIGVNIFAPEEVLKIATVWRCVNLKAGGIATLPWNVVRPDGMGNKRPVNNHPIGRLLNSTPNPEMTAFSFRTTMMQHKLLYGNAYAEIEVDASGRAVALWPIAPDRVEPWRDDDGSLFYRISQPTGGFSEIQPDLIFHVPGMGWDGVRGYSILEVATQSLGGSYAMDRFAGRYFGYGMQPSGVVTIPEGVVFGEEEMDRLRAEFARKHQGWNAAQEPLILSDGMTYSQAMHEPDKAQLLDTRKFSVYDICRWFGVPPYLAFASDEEPRANVETQSREFLMYGLDPEIEPFQQEANRKLFYGFRPPLETAMDTLEFQLGDLKTRGEYYKTMRQLGVFSVNDILRREGMPTIGPEGDVRVMQVQFQPVGPDGAPTVPQTGQPGTAGEAVPMAGLTGKGRVNGHMNGNGGMA